MGNIRDRKRVAEELWDWEFLNPCFGETRIRVSDVDGEVERNGYFLVLEGKPIGCSIDKMKYGQRQKLQLQSESPVNTVLVLEGSNPDDPQMAAYQFFGEKRVVAKPRTNLNEEVMIMVSQWFQWANSNPRVDWSKSIVRDRSGKVIEPYISNSDHGRVQTV